MTQSTTSQTFTLRNANAMLPLVKSIVTDIVQLTSEVSQTRERLDDLGDCRVPSSDSDVYSTELNAIREATERQSDRVRDCVEELNELSVWPRSLVTGYVDFPAIREHEEICLCWRLGDPEVMYWHRSDEPCSKRQLADLNLIRQSAAMPRVLSTEY